MQFNGLGKYRGNPKDEQRETSLPANRWRELKDIGARGEFP